MSTEYNGSRWDYTDTFRVTVMVIAGFSLCPEVYNGRSDRQQWGSLSHLELFCTGIVVFMEGLLHVANSYGTHGREVEGLATNSL